MIITLKGATFTHKLNLNVWLVNSSLVGVDSSNTASSVTKDGSYTTTFTIRSGFKIDADSTVSVVCNGQTYPLSWSSTEAGGTASLKIDKVTAPITITVKASTVSGTVVNPDTGDDNEETVTGVSIDVTSRTTTNSHAQSLPSGTTSTTNLWNALTPEAKYYDASGSYVQYQKVSSIVFPVLPGDKLTATSFGTNSGYSNGIRITYLSDDTVVSSLTAAQVYSEYTTNGYVTAPADVNAVCIPVWDNTATGHEVYLFPVGATGTPTAPGNSDSTGGNSGSTDSGNTGVEDTSGATWYVNHVNNISKFTSSVNIAGRGWTHVPGTPAYNAYVGKPVNTIGFFTTLESQNITIGKVVEKGDVSSMTEIATVTATNPSGTTKGFCYVTFPTVTLSEGECLALFAQDDANINFYYASSNGVTDANGIVDGNFYGRVPKVYGSGNAWTSYSASICLGISVGYTAS